METCESCKYWLNEPVNPRCRRFPTYTIHGANDWCGEYWPCFEILGIETQEAESPIAELARLAEVNSVVTAVDAPEVSAATSDDSMQAEAERLRAENEALKAKQPPKRKRK